MTTDELVATYRAYLVKQRKDDGSSQTKLYLKDKTSRLKAMLRVLDARSLGNVSSRNFYSICDKVIGQFALSYKNASGKTVYQYSRYLVVVRQLYEMNTGNAAPRFQHMHGVRKLV